MDELVKKHYLDARRSYELRSVPAKYSLNWARTKARIDREFEQADDEGLEIVIDGITVNVTVENDEDWANDPDIDPGPNEMNVGVVAKINGHVYGSVWGITVPESFSMYYSQTDDYYYVMSEGIDVAEEAVNEYRKAKREAEERMTALMAG